MKYEQRGYGKPYMRSLDEIEEQLPELQPNGVNKQEFKDGSEIKFEPVKLKESKELSDYIISIDDLSSDKTNVPSYEGNGDYQEVISLGNHPTTTYQFSLEAVKELSKVVGEPEYNSETLETLTRDAIRKDLVYVKQAGFKEERLFNHLGREVIELNPIKYILASYERGEDLTENDSFLEVQTNDPLPGDIICIDYLDLPTKKKLNNLEYGGSNHDFFEPIAHEWENEHYND